MSYLITGIQLACMGIGFIIIMVLFASVAFAAWIAIAFWLKCREVAREQESIFKADLEKMYSGLQKSEFDAMYREFWEKHNEFSEN